MTTDDTRFVELYILHVLQIACHLSGATRGLASRTYHPNGSRAGTYPQMTRDLLNHIYTCTANRVPLGQVLLGDYRLGRIIRLVVEQTYHPNGCQDRYQSSDDTRFVELYILHVLQIACHLSRASQ